MAKNERSEIARGTITATLLTNYQVKLEKGSVKDPLVVLTKILEDEEEKTVDRIAAAKVILSHTLNKAPVEKFVQMNVESPVWEGKGKEGRELRIKELLSAAMPNTIKAGPLSTKETIGTKVEDSLTKEDLDMVGLNEEYSLREALEAQSTYREDAMLEKKIIDEEYEAYRNSLSEEWDNHGY